MIAETRLVIQTRVVDGSWRDVIVVEDTAREEREARSMMRRSLTAARGGPGLVRLVRQRVSTEVLA